MSWSRLVRSRVLALAAALVVLSVTVAAKPPPGGGGGGGMSPTATPIQIFGAWHCSDDACTWATVRDVDEFDTKNHWLIDRGNGEPSVNLVILSFVHPLKLLNLTTDAGTLNGVPRGMTPAIVDYFKSEGIRVMVSIGGITYTDAWNQALAQNASLLGQRAAALATQLGVGVEIDYEENTNPNLTGLQAFIDAYRTVHPYDPTGNDHAARLTIDTAAGDRWLIAINQKATADWLRTDAPVLDYANAMVPARQPSASGADRQLAGAHRRQAAVQPAGRAAGAGQVHRVAVCRRGLACPGGVQQLRRLGDQGHRRLRPARPAAPEPHRPVAGHARVHVLGGRTAVDPRRHDATAELVRGRHGRRRGHAGHAVADGAAPPAVRAAALPYG